MKWYYSLLSTSQNLLFLLLIQFCHQSWSFEKALFDPLCDEKFDRNCLFLNLLQSQWQNQNAPISKNKMNQNEATSKLAPRQIAVQPLYAIFNRKWRNQMFYDPTSNPDLTKLEKLTRLQKRTKWQSQKKLQQQQRLNAISLANIVGDNKNIVIKKPSHQKFFNWGGKRSVSSSSTDEQPIIALWSSPEFTQLDEPFDDPSQSFQQQSSLPILPKTEESSEKRTEIAPTASTQIDGDFISTISSSSDESRPLEETISPGEYRHIRRSSVPPKVHFLRQNLRLIPATAFGFVDRRTAAAAFRRRSKNTNFRSPKRPESFPKSFYPWGGKRNVNTDDKHEDGSLSSIQMLTENESDGDVKTNNDSLESTHTNDK